MESNDGTNPGTDAGQSGADEFSGNGSTEASSFDVSKSAGATEQGRGIRDRAKEAVSGTGERLATMGSTVRERAGSAKNRLADVLESGAEKLRRQRVVDEVTSLAGAAADGSSTIQSDARIAQVSDRVAGGMQASAEWLRDADLDSLKTGVEQQVKEHPGRTLLIAAGLGYLIGRAFKNNQ